MKLTITIDGKAYEVDVEVTEDDRQSGPQGTYYGGATAPVNLPPAMPPPALGAAAPAGNFADDKVCRSPIAGIVVRVIAQPGQQVEVNDPLMVLEAMKMETNITSPAKAKIKSMNASAGEAVQINQVLVEFE
ncbi:MAG: acetyl-CoA carboxylase biotin carboxyl carrier protein subunit [Acidobacteria bacterium]|nr:acetyl-CoA carboxylase biotin carboxyl carrier protein subunit [Acidobacteriota bacterium]